MGAIKGQYNRECGTTFLNRILHGTLYYSQTAIHQAVTLTGEAVNHRITLIKVSAPNTCPLSLITRRVLGLANSASFVMKNVEEGPMVLVFLSVAAPRKHWQSLGQPVFHIIKSNCCVMKVLTVMLQSTRRIKKE